MQAVIQSPFSNGGSPTGEAPETRFAYFPAAAGDGSVVTAQGGDPVTAGTLGPFI